MRSLSVLLALLVCTFPLRAQSWDLVRGLKTGDRVRVEESGGAQHKGAVTAVTPDGLSLTTGGAQVSIERSRVKRVQLHSGSRRARNIAIGAAVGVAIGVVVDQTIGRYLRNESGDEGRPVMYLAPIGIFAGIGAVLSPYRTIYRLK